MAISKDIYIQGSSKNLVGIKNKFKGIGYAGMKRFVSRYAGADKGFFMTPAELKLAYPNGIAGWYARVDGTQTTWYWSPTANDRVENCCGGIADIPPAISLASPQSGTYEKGVSVGPVTLNATVTAGTNPVTAISFFRGATNIQSGLLTNKIDNGPFTVNTSRNATATDGTLTATSNSVGLTFYQPYFYGKSTTLPIPGQALINSGTKVIANSAGTITINFGSDDYDYIWFAIPATSISKTKWYVDVINNGAIGGAGDLFGAETTAIVNSPTLIWSNVNYKFYVSNRQSASSQPMEMRNS